MNDITLMTYTLLYLLVLSLWLPPIRSIKIWQPITVLCVACGYWAHRITSIGIFYLVIFTLIVRSFAHAKKRSTIWLLSGSLILSLATGFAAHLIPGFDNLCVLNHIILSPGAQPYTLYLNLDKTLAAILLAGYTQSRIHDVATLWCTIKQALPVTITTTIGVIALALFLGILRFDPKFLSEFFIWAITNLCLTCFAEEILFRGFLQENISIFLGKHQMARSIAIMSTAVIFGLAHLAGGWRHMILATIAGFGYGMAYHLSRRIEASIFSHFMLNLTHFLWFTYPALG